MVDVFAEKVVGTTAVTFRLNIFVVVKLPVAAAPVSQLSGGSLETH